MNDQIGTPTDVYALSKLVQLVIEEELRGLFHAANHGQASWFDFAELIFKIEPDERVVAIKNVSVNEPFFQGHVPDLPVMPGVMIIESMAQVGALLPLFAASW